MTEQEGLRQRIGLRYYTLLDMALSLAVLQNPERFGGAAPWAPRLEARMPGGLAEQLRAATESVDLFELLYQLDPEGSLPVGQALKRLEDPTLRALLQLYWEVISPEVAGWTGLVADSIQQETQRLQRMDPLAFICRFSDRVSVTGEGTELLLQWGKGIRIPLAALSRILFIPSVFSPRRLMFYRLDDVQVFFYAPQLPGEKESVAEAPESLVLGYSALADATRLKLLHLIAHEILPAQEMAQRLGLNESTVSRHLRLLVEAGLIARERSEGKYVFYGLYADRIDRLAAGLLRYLGRSGAALIRS